MEIPDDLIPLVALGLAKLSPEYGVSAASVAAARILAKHLTGQPANWLDVLEACNEQWRDYAHRYGYPEGYPTLGIVHHEDEKAAREHFGGLKEPHCISAGSAVEPEGYSPEMAYDRLQSYPADVDESFDCILIESP